MTEVRILKPAAKGLRQDWSRDNTAPETAMVLLGILNKRREFKVEQTDLTFIPLLVIQSFGNHALSLPRVLLCACMITTNHGVSS